MMEFLEIYYIGFDGSFDQYEAEGEQAYIELHGLEDEAIELIMLNHQVLEDKQRADE